MGLEVCKVTLSIEAVDYTPTKTPLTWNNAMEQPSKLEFGKDLRSLSSPSSKQITAQTVNNFFLYLLPLN